ncbi:MAG: zinc ribbon domain-containing protein [Symbiobacteriia bacterium]
MLKRWLPKDPILTRAAIGLLVFVIAGVAAAGMRAWDASSHRWERQGTRAVTEAVTTYGVNSPEAAQAVKAMAQAPGAEDLVALLDPATGKTVAASPEDLVGKAPDEMTVCGIKLPALSALLSRQRFDLAPAGSPRNSRFAGARADQVLVCAIPIYPGSTGKGGPGDRFGYGDRGGFRGGFRGEFGGGFRGGERGWGGLQPRSGQPPLAVFLIAEPHVGITVPRVLGGVFHAVAMLGFILYWLSIAWWVFTDARRRSGRAFAWGLLTLLTNLVGLSVYLIVRQERRSCPTCNAAIENQYAHCPNCGEPLKRFCVGCKEELRPGWGYCPKCGRRSDGAAVPAKPAEPEAQPD